MILVFSKMVDSKLEVIETIKNPDFIPRMNEHIIIGNRGYEVVMVSYIFKTNTASVVIRRVK